MKKWLSFMLSLVILLCMLTACDEDMHDDSEEITDYQHARVLISFGKIEQAYDILLNSDDADAKLLLENFAFLPQSIRHDENRFREFTYDSTGNLLRNSYYEHGKVCEEDIYTYYASGKVHTYETDGFFLHFIYTYREDGQYESIKTINDNGRWDLTVYSYDDAGNKTVAKSTSNMSSEVEYTTYSYDQWGNCVLMHTLIEGGYQSRSSTTRYSYNEHGKLTSEEHTTKDGVSKKLYEYDQNGNVIRREEISVKGLSWVYTYVRNSEGLVTKLTTTYPDGKVYTDTYEYDSKGNEILEVSTSPTGITSETHQYDQQGNLIEYTLSFSGKLFQKNTQTFDQYGNVLESIRTQSDEPDEYDRFNYVYDEFGRVVDVIHFDTETRMSSHQEYTYDEYGHIVAVQKYDDKGTQRLNYESKMELRYYPNGVPEIIRKNYEDNLYKLCFEFLTE